jgi:Flp pilus assembly protein TadG
MINALRSFRRDRRGAALVEFTLLAPMLIFLMCGMGEFANAMRQYHIMEKGVRDAGRYLAREPMNGCAINSNAVATAKNLALTGQPTGSTYLLRTWTDPNTITVTVAQCVDNSSGAYRGLSQIPVLQVTASAPYVDLGLLSIIGIGPINLQASHQQLWIGA